MLSNMSFKELMVRTLRITMALLVSFALLMILVQFVPFTLVFVGSFLGIPAKVTLTSADFYVWMLTSLFVVALYVYGAIQLITTVWFKVSGLRRLENVTRHKAVAMGTAKMITSDDSSIQEQKSKKKNHKNKK